MKKFNPFLLIFSIMAFFVVCTTVNAENYEVTPIAYNITDAWCDLEEEYGGDCFNKILAGEVDDYLMTNGIVSGGQNVFVVFNIKVPETGSQLGGFQFQYNHDTSKLTSYNYVSGELEDIGFNKNTYYHSYGMLPIKPAKNGTYSASATSTWSLSATAEESDTVFVGAAEDGKLPMTRSGNVFGIIYTVAENVTPGSKIYISPSTTLGDNDFTTTESVQLTGQYKLNTLELSVLSNVSTDGTLKTLTATGTSHDGSHNYMLDKFIPSDDKNLTYYLTVPNDVDTITFAGQPTNENTKSITGLTSHSLNVGDNVKNITIVAESGDSTIYEIHIRRLSNEAKLQSITTTNYVKFVNGTMIYSPTMVNTLDDNTFEYSANVAYKTTSTTTTATPKDELATVVGDGVWSIPTDNQTNKKTTYPVTVSAENCDYSATDVPGNVCTKQTYNFNITRMAPSKDVTLSSLEVDNVAVPGFDPATTTYTLDAVPYSKDKVNVTATINDNKNEIIAGLGEQNLNVGNNTIEVIVKSEDGVTTGSYYINIYRKSQENTLQSLSVTSNPSSSLVPPFPTSTTRQYAYTYDAHVNSLTISATAKDIGKAKVSIVDASDASAETTLVAPTLNSASTSIGTTVSKVKVIVTPEDEATDPLVYTISLTRQLSDNNYLSELKLNPGTFDSTPNLLSDDPYYYATVDSEISSTTVTATLADENATLGTITGTNGKDGNGFEFGYGNVDDNLITIPVTSESGNTRIYKIKVKRKEYTIATLDDLRVGFDGATPTTISGFNKDVFEYTLYTQASPLDFNIDNINIEYTKTNSYATVTGDTGAKVVRTGDNQYQITVKSQDQTTTDKKTNVYKINVYRQKNNDNETKGLTVAGETATPESVSDGEIPDDYYVTLDNSVTSIVASQVVVSVSDDAKVVDKMASLTLATKTDNVYTYKVEAENGEKKEYRIHITRSSSDDANITTVKLRIGDDATRSCTFSGRTSAEGYPECTISVPLGTTEYYLEPIMNSEATLTPAKTTKYEMDPSDPSDSTQRRQLTVLAEDGTTEAHYVVIVERAKSSNTKLTDISLTNVTDGANETIPLTYVDGKTTYNVTVPGTVEDVKVDATLADSKAKFADGQTIPDTITLSTYGINQYIITVVAEDGVATQNYTLNITRSQKIENRLQEFKVAVGSDTLADLAGFGPNETTLTYRNLNYDETSLKIKTTVVDNLSSTQSENAIVKEIKVNNNSVAITSAESVETTIPLATGTNTIEVTVAAQNRSITKTYTLTVERAKNRLAEIEKVEVYYDGAFHEATKNAQTGNYEIEVPYSVSTAQGSTANVNGYVKVTPKNGATSGDALATVAMSTTSLVTDDPTNGNVNTHNFSLQAEDPTVPAQIYNLLITRTKNHKTELSRVNVFKGSETTTNTYCVIEDNSTLCEISVPETTNAIRLESVIPSTSKNATVSYTDGTITGDSYTFAANETEKNITVTVTAENGTDTQDYNVKIVKSKSSNAYISTIKTNANQSNVDTLVEINNYESTNTTPETIVVPGTTNSIKINALAEDPKTTLSTNSVTGVTPGNEITFVADLAYGENTFVIDTVAQNGTTKLHYTVKVLRQKNVEKRLSMIYIDGESINNYLSAGTTFDPDTHIYEINELAYNRSTINVTATNIDTEYGTVTGTGNKNVQTKYYGKTYPVAASDEYTNVITITSYAHNNDLNQDYTIRVKRTPNSSTALVKMFVTYDGSEHEAVCTNISNRKCTITVPNSVKVIESNMVRVEGAPGKLSSDAIATGVATRTTLETTDSEGNVVLNSVPIRVTAEDGTQTGTNTNPDYELIVSRQKSSDATLKSLKVYNEEGTTVIGTFNPTFNESLPKEQQVYTVNIPEGTEKINIIGEMNDPHLNITGDNGVQTLTSSTQTFVVRTSSEDGTQTMTYTLNIVRAANNNINLGSIKVIGSDGVDYSNKITPTISATETTYTAEVPGSLTYADVTIAPSYQLSTIFFDPNDAPDALNPDQDTDTVDGRYNLSSSTTDVIKEVKFIVKSEQGTERPYTLKLVVKPKTDNNLSSLKYKLGNGEYVELLTAEAIANGTTDFELADVEYAISQISIDATPNANSDATVSGNVGNNISITTAENGNTYRILVTSQAGVQKVYTIKVKRLKNTDATLKELNFEGASLNETFVRSDATHISYTMNVSETRDKILASEVTATPTDSNATVTLLADKNDTDTDITGNLDMAASGDYNYKIKVTAQDGTSSLIYTVTVTRPKSTNTYLKSVSLVNATLDPGTISHTSNRYTLRVSNGTTSLKIKGIPEVNTSTVSYSGTYTHDTVNDLYEYSNIYDGQQIILSVASETDTTIVSPRQYIFTVEFNKSSDATLKSSATGLEVAGYKFYDSATGDQIDNYSGATDNYVKLPKAVTQVKVKTDRNDPNAKVEYYHGNTKITTCDGDNNKGANECIIDINSGLVNGNIRVHVTAQDEVTSKDYYIYYSKVGSNDARLKKLTPSTGELDNEFNSGTEIYNLTIDSETTSVTFDLETEDADAYVSANGEMQIHTLQTTIENIPDGETTTVSIIVKAEDNVATKTYTVNIFRPTYLGDGDSSLETLTVTDGVNPAKTYTLTPTFDAGTKSYSIGTIDFAVTSLKITANTNKSTSTVAYYVNGAVQGSNIVSLPQVAGDGRITVKVTAQNGKFTSYAISYTKSAASENNLLGSLVVEGATLDQVFAPETSVYNTTIPATQNTIDITAIPQDPTATIRIDGESYTPGELLTKTIPSGNSVVNIVVTSQKGTTKTYQIKIKKESNNEQITSVTYGHIIEDGYIKSVKYNRTALDVKNQLDNDNSKLEVWTADNTRKLSDSEKVGTGMIVKLIINGTLADSKTIVIWGDVNGDGEIDGWDLGDMVNHFVYDNDPRFKLTGAYLIAGDVNSDGDYCDGWDLGDVVNEFVYEGGFIPYK